MSPARSSIPRHFEDGWFRTGDLAEQDAAGGVCLKGRENDVINVAGLKVIPREVEDVISLLPGVVEVKVYPGVYPSGSQYVKAAVVAEQPVRRGRGAGPLPAEPGLLQAARAHRALGCLAPLGSRQDRPRAVALREL